MRLVCQKPRARASSKRLTIARAAFGLASKRKSRTGGVPSVASKRSSKWWLLTAVGQHRESIEMVDRSGDFGGAAMAVAHLPGDPARVRRARAHDTGDFLLQGAHLDRAGACCFDMIDRGVVAEHLCGRGKASLMIEDGVGIENVLLVLILHMNESVGGGDTLGEGRCGDAFALGPAIGMRGRGEIARAKCFARKSRNSSSIARERPIP